MLKSNNIYIVQKVKISMPRENTVWGAYDRSLDEEITRVIEKLKELGIRNPTKIEATALIAQSNKKTKISTLEIKEFFRRIRGV